MNDFFIYLLFGHIVGDYLFQPIWMALTKKTDKSAARLHCFIYTVIVFFATVSFIDGILPKYNIYYCFIWAILIFYSHMILDSTHIVDNFLHITGGRSYRRANDYINNHGGSTNIECQYMVAYTAIVQTVVDNFLHIFSMYFFYKILFHFFGKIN